MFDTATLYQLISIKLKMFNKLEIDFIKHCFFIKHFPVWLRNRLISAGLEPVLSHTEKSYILLNVLYPVFHEYKNVQS